VRRLLNSIFILLLIVYPAICQEAEKQEEKAEKKAITNPEMTTYYVGFLLRGPKWTPEVTPEVERIQKEHLAHIRKMAESGKLILAGPFMDGGNLRGMFVFRVETIEEAKTLSEADPAVKAGRLVVDLHPWYSAKGINIDPNK
jgi:uncharacterized protein